MSEHAQKLFDIATKGVLAQGRQAVDDTDTCRLRTDNGDKCAVGFLIPDDLYYSALETDSGIVVSERYFQGPLWKILCEVHGALDERDAELLRELQELHDYHFDYFQAGIKEIAEEFGLDV